MNKSLFIVLLSGFLLGCTSNETDNAGDKEPSKTGLIEDSGSILLQKTIEAHGGSLYNHADYSFTFRDITYGFKNSGDQFEYSRLEVIAGQSVLDIMTNDAFTRQIDGEFIEVSKEKAENFRESINSVIYFATLPHKLGDDSVISKDLGTTTIKNKSYHVVQVRFKEDGGGRDFQDEYMYWINTESHFVDYLAYTYQVNGGGVRFRSAFNQRDVDGIRFQDYVNYEAEIGTPLEQLPALYENGSLNELSIIATENVLNRAE